MPGMGSTGPADAATEAFMRYLAAEVGPRGVRVCGIWTAGVAETLSEKKLTEVGGANPPEPRSVVEMIAGMAALCRAPRLAEVVEVAVFLASDGAAGMTGTIDADPTDRREAASWISSSNSCWFPSRTWTPPTPSTSRKPASLWTSTIASVTSCASCSRRHRARRGLGVLDHHGDGDHGSGAGLRFSSPGWTAPGPGRPSPGQRGYPESVPSVRLSRSGGGGRENEPARHLPRPR